MAENFFFPRGCLQGKQIVRIFSFPASQFPFYEGYQYRQYKMEASKKQKKWLKVESNCNLLLPFMPNSGLQQIKFGKMKGGRVRENNPVHPVFFTPTIKVEKHLQ